MKKPFATLPLVGVILLAAFGLYWVKTESGKVVETPPPAAGVPAGSLKPLATGPLAAFLVHETRKEVGAFTFKDGSGKDRTLAEFKGKVVLLNLWATWCAPCRKEMPDIAKLQKELGGKDFEVVAVSLDIKGPEASAAFLKDVGAENLTLYLDTASKSLTALQALGLPATLLIDRDGKEAGRLLGPADWASPEAVALIKAIVAQGV